MPKGIYVYTGFKQLLKIDGIFERVGIFHSSLILLSPKVEILSFNTPDKQQLNSDQTL